MIILILIIIIIIIKSGYVDLELFGEWFQASLVFSQHEYFTKLNYLTKNYTIFITLLRDDRSLFIARGCRGFLLRQRSTYVIPLLKHTVSGSWSSNLIGGRFHDPPPLLSQPPQKANVTDMHASDIYIYLILTSHEPWTTSSHIWSSHMSWIVCEGLLFSSKSLKT